MTVYDNVLTPQVLESLKERIFRSDVPWYFIPTTVPGSIERNILDNSFGQIIFSDNNISSPLFDSIYTSFLFMLDKCNIKIDRLFRIRLGLLQATSGVNHKNVPHVDSNDHHKVGLFYLNGTDGVTTIYKEKFNPNIKTKNDPFSRIDPLTYYKDILKEKLTVDKEVECKENRLVIFDGMTYHSSTTPTNVPRRITINFNFV